MYWNPISEEDFQEICAGMERAEKEHLFDEMFTGACRQIVELPTKEKLLDSIRPDMKLYKSTFMKIYADEITYPGFADKAIKMLEEVGCSKARQYYEQIVEDYQKKHDEELKPVAKGLREQWEKDWEKLQKRSEEQRKQKTQLPKETVSAQILGW